jgi:hypothetical protein
MLIPKPTPNYCLSIFSLLYYFIHQDLRREAFQLVVTVCTIGQDKGHTGQNIYLQTEIRYVALANCLPVTFVPIFRLLQ